jgi:hypothetical protein
MSKDACGATNGSFALPKNDLHLDLVWDMRVGRQKLCWRQSKSLALSSVGKAGTVSSSLGSIHSCCTFRTN